MAALHKPSALGDVSLLDGLDALSERGVAIRRVFVGPDGVPVLGCTRSTNRDDGIGREVITQRMLLSSVGLDTIRKLETQALAQAAGAAPGERGWKLLDQCDGFTWVISAALKRAGVTHEV